MHQQPQSMAAAESKPTQAPRVAVAVAVPGLGRRDWAVDYCARHEDLDDGGADLLRQVCQQRDRGTQGYVAVSDRDT